MPHCLLESTLTTPMRVQSSQCTARCLASNRSFCALPSAPWNAAGPMQACTMAGSGEGSWRWTGTSTSGCRTSSAAARRARSQLNSAAVSTVSCRCSIQAVNNIQKCRLL